MADESTNKIRVIVCRADEQAEHFGTYCQNTALVASPQTPASAAKKEEPYRSK